MLVAIAAKMGLDLRKVVERWLERTVCLSGRSARVKVLVVAVLTVQEKGGK